MVRATSSKPRRKAVQVKSVRAKSTQPPNPAVDRGRKGEFEWISKWAINIPNEMNVRLNDQFQRDRHAASQKRIEILKRHWRWEYVGTLIVSRRKDHSLWLVDGQHRLMAARALTDIAEMPCIVVDTSDLVVRRAVQREAAMFVAVNDDRMPVGKSDLFRARVVERDADAVEVAALVEGMGYQWCGSSRKVLRCISSVYDAYRNDKDATRRVVEVCHHIAFGDRWPRNVFDALVKLDWHLQRTDGRTVADESVVSRFRAMGIKHIQGAGVEKQIKANRTGGIVFCQGVVDALNARMEKHELIAPICKW